MRKLIRAQASGYLRRPGTMALSLVHGVNGNAVPPVPPSTKTHLQMPASKRPALLLIHGFPLDATSWNDQVSGLADVANVIAPDLRGFGNDTRELPGTMTMEAHAQDLKDLLDEHEVEQVVLCGLSMGGYIAMAFAERWPERVAGLVLANTKATADDGDAREGREQSALNAMLKGMVVVGRAMAPKLLTETTRKEQPGLLRRVEDMIAIQRPEAAAASSRGMAQRSDKLECLKRLDASVLVITGDADELMPLATSQAMAKAAADSSLVVIPKAGHLSNLERPVAFNNAVRNFLKAL